MRRFTLVFVSLCLFSLVSFAQRDTVYLSTAFTTHIIYPTDITYADISDTKLVVAKVVQQNMNMIALKAREPFDGCTSVSTLESNGHIHTYIVAYKEHPDQLVIDEREDAALTMQSPEKLGITQLGNTPKADGLTSLNSTNASTWKGGAVPVLSELITANRDLYHIACSDYGISVACENIWSYNDITYIILSVTNLSGISYNISDPSFVIESKKNSKKTVNYNTPLIARSKYGTLTAPPNTRARMVLTLDKMTLSRDQILKIYFYEDGGQRNLSLTLDTKDINAAIPLPSREDLQAKPKKDKTKN